MCDKLCCFTTIRQRTSKVLKFEIPQDTGSRVRKIAYRNLSALLSTTAPIILNHHSSVTWGSERLDVPWSVVRELDVQLLQRSSRVSYIDR